MNAATVGFAVFLILSLAAATLLVRQVIRGVRDGHSATSEVNEGRYFFAESCDEGERVMKKGIAAEAD